MEFNDKEVHEEGFSSLKWLFVLKLLQRQCKRFTKLPMCDRGKRGAHYAFTVLTSINTWCYDLFLMDIDVFQSLCKILHYKQWLQNSKFSWLLRCRGANFCRTLCHNESNWKAADRIQHSRETIYRHFRRVLKAIVKLGIELISPPNFDDELAEIRSNL